MDGALGGLLPGNATQLAMLAVRLHGLLIDLVAEHGSTVPETPAVLERLSSALRTLVR
jgi:hypothetical protein